MKVFIKRRRLRVAAVMAGAAMISAFAGTTALSNSAHADPLSTTAFAGVGSSTLQDVVDAFAGAAPTPPSGSTVFFTPIHSSAATNEVTIQSWDAFPPGGSAAAPGCIATKVGGPTFDRPAGSGNGRLALLAAVNGMSDRAAHPLRVRSLQEFHSGGDDDQPQLEF